MDEILGMFQKDDDKRKDGGPSEASPGGANDGGGATPVRKVPSCVAAWILNEPVEKRRMGCEIFACVVSFTAQTLFFFLNKL